MGLPTDVSQPAVCFGQKSFLGKFKIVLFDFSMLCDNNTAVVGID